MMRLNNPDVYFLPCVEDAPLTNGTKTKKIIHLDRHNQRKMPPN